MPVTWHTVRRMFSGIDIATMRELGHPLDNYDYVVQNANHLLKRLEDGSMPPPPFGPWEQEWIDIFKEWIDGGFQYKPEKDVPRLVSSFIGLSQALTGFDDLVEDPDQAAKNLNSLTSWAIAYSFQPIKPDKDKDRKYGNLVSALNALLDGWRTIENEADGDDEAIRDGLTELAKKKLQDDGRRDFVDVVRAILRLWYTGSLPNVSESQWVDGLMWRAALAHPPGFSTEGSYSLEGDGLKGKKLYGHWSFKPQPDGRYTGLGNTATHLKTRQASK